MGGNGKFTDGLLLGALLGGAAVFLLGTKKGNKVLKIITEEGIAGFSSLVEDFEDHRNGVTPEPAAIKKAKADDIEEIDEIEMVLNQAPKVEKAEKDEAPKSKPSKRFFRKSK